MNIEEINKQRLELTQKAKLINKERYIKLLKKENDALQKEKKS